jgi:transcriptional regulator with XRE-family HTH domain
MRIIVYMSMSICSKKKSGEVIRRVWGQLFGIFTRKARENSVLPLEAVARLAGMGVEEWLAIEAGRVPDPEKLDLMAAVLGLSPDEMGVAVRICKDAWVQ